MPLLAPEWLQRWLVAPELRAWRQIVSLRAELRRVIDRAKPDVIAIEIPSGKFGTGAKCGARGSLTTYGLAAGVMIEACCRKGVPVVPVTERQWTAGQADKWARQTAIAAMYPQYDSDKDPGADVSDAVGLGRWWLRRVNE